MASSARRPDLLGASEGSAGKRGCSIDLGYDGVVDRPGDAVTPASDPARRRIQISTDTSPALNGVTTAIGGGPAMVRDGKAIARNEVNIRNPRAAIGWNRDYLILV